MQINLFPGDSFGSKEEGEKSKQSGEKPNMGNKRNTKQIQKKYKKKYKRNTM